MDRGYRRCATGSAAWSCSPRRERVSHDQLGVEGRHERRMRSQEAPPRPELATSEAVIFPGVVTARSSSGRI